jgi:hypothetical protein
MRTASAVGSLAADEHIGKNSTRSAPMSGRGPPWEVLSEAREQAPSHGCRGLWGPRASPQSPEQAPPTGGGLYALSALLPSSHQRRTPGAAHPALATCGSDLRRELLARASRPSSPDRTDGHRASRHKHPPPNCRHGATVPLPRVARQQDSHAPRNGSSSDSSRPRPASTLCGKRLVCRSIIRRTFGGSSPRCKARSRSGM